MILLLLTGCLPHPEADSGRTLTVLAAASLTDAFTDLEARFEADHPGVDVRISFAGSQALAAQVRQGAPADVVAVAHPALLDDLADAGLTLAPTAFAANALALARPAGAPGPLDLGALPDAEALVLGASAAPIGGYTEALLDAAAEHRGPAWRAAVEARVVSREPNVRQAAAKVALGEADAAIVYATDALPGLALSPLDGPRATLSQALLPDASDLAEDWAALVAGPPGQRALARRGFLAP